jgi:hypothetical protein
VRDPVSGTVGSATDGVAVRRYRPARNGNADNDAIRAVTKRTAACGIRADEIAANRIAVTLHTNSPPVIARDYVTHSRSGATDRITHRIVQEDSISGITKVGTSGRSSAYEVPENLYRSCGACQIDSHRVPRNYIPRCRRCSSDCCRNVDQKPNTVSVCNSAGDVCPEVVAFGKIPGTKRKAQAGVRPRVNDEPSNGAASAA